MPLPEGYRPREGDELLIRAKVAYDCEPNDGSVHIKLVGAEYKSAVLALTDVHALHCRAWNEGDKVVQKNWGHGTVLAVHENMAWVHLKSGQMATFEANELEPYVEPAEDLGNQIVRQVIEKVDAALVPPPAPGSQADVGDDDEMKF